MVRSESTTPLSMAADPSLSSANSHYLGKSTQNNSSQTLIIAISGCSSSGKTLLSLLLEAVFTGLNFSVSRLTKPQKSFSTILIHEDNYFVSKDDCPLVTFESANTDIHFILKSIIHGAEGPYYRHKQSKTATAEDAYLQDRILKELVIQRITGPDTDCWEAIDIPALIQALNNIKTSTTPIEYCQKHAGLENNKLDMTRWAKSIQEMRQLVEQWLIKEDIITNVEINRVNLTNTLGIKDSKNMLPTLCFVEGFLLYTDPNTTYPAHFQKEHDAGLTSNGTTAVPLQDTCSANNQGVNSSMSQTPDSINNSSANILQEFKSSCVQKQQLMSLFDLKLFLPTSRDVSKVRRFSRKPYMDHPQGERMEGQYWKTEGYFDGVAWPNYEKFHRWLLIDNKGMAADEKLSHVKPTASEDVSTEIRIKHWKKGDVHIREIDAGVEDTLRWAVGMILAEISRRRQISR